MIFQIKLFVLALSLTAGLGLVLDSGTHFVNLVNSVATEKAQRAGHYEPLAKNLPR